MPEMLNGLSEAPEGQSCDATSPANQPAQQQLLWRALHPSADINAFLVSTHVTLVSLYK